MPEPTPLFERKSLAGAKFIDVNLSSSLFNDVNIRDAEFVNVSLAGAVFRDINFADVSIDDSNLAGMRIDGVLVSELFRAYRQST